MEGRTVPPEGRRIFLVALSTLALIYCNTPSCRYFQTKCVPVDFSHKYALERS